VRRSSEAARAVVLTFALAFVWLVAWVATPWAYVVAAGRAPAAVPALRALGLDLEATIGRRVTALDLAVASGDARAAEVLMANGARVDGPGRLSLAYAVFRGDTATLGAMLAHGADPDARIAPDGTTALIGSIMRGDDAARVLLDAGADPNLANAAGVTPLMLAAQNRNGAAVRLLLERGADVNARDARGSTSLMYAARALDRDGMEALRRAGADPSVEDAFGRTAADVFAGAEAEGDDEEADDEDGEA
jgi:ankyrin repeat protein